MTPAVDGLGVAALALVCVEWFALGALSGVDWPRAAGRWWLPRGAVWILVGAALTSLAQLALALIGFGFFGVPLTLVVAAIIAIALRAVSVALAKPPTIDVRTRTVPMPTPRTHRLPTLAALRAVGLHALSPSGSEATSAPLPPVGTHPALPHRETSREPVQMDRAERWAWAALAALLAAATLRSLIVPEAGWDAYSHWGLRAQAYALSGTVTNAGSEHEYYPPLVPLLEAWLYLHRGAVLIDLGKTISAVIGSAFAICLAWHLRMVLRPVWLAPLASGAIVLATTELLDGFWTGQADLPLTAWLTLATLAAWQWLRTTAPAADHADHQASRDSPGSPATRPASDLQASPGGTAARQASDSPASADTPEDRQASDPIAWADGTDRQAWLVQAGVFAAAAAFTKLEGLPRILIVAAAVLLCAYLPRAKLATGARLAASTRLAAVLVLSALAATLLWTSCAALAGITPNSEHFGAFQLTVLPGVTIALVQTFGGLRTGGALLIVAAAWLLAYRQLPRLLVIVTLGQLALTLLAFLLSAVSPDVEVRTSATRLFEQLLPVALVAAAVGLRRLGLRKTREVRPTSRFAGGSSSAEPSRSD